jgi:hypothetical protein
VTTPHLNIEALKRKHGNIKIVCKPPKMDRGAVAIPQEYWSALATLFGLCPKEPMHDWQKEGF